MHVGSFLVPTFFITAQVYLLGLIWFLGSWGNRFGGFSYKQIWAHLLWFILGGWGGAKLFYILFYQNLPLSWQLMTEPGGRVFYGSLLGLWLAMFILTRFMPDADVRREYWDTGAKCLAIGIGIFRIQCFLDGCCFGTISAKPWAVVYENPAAFIPLLGVPVHPVQLYESAVGFSLFFILCHLQRRGYSCIHAFFIFYPTARFFIEFWRGDDALNSEWIMGLSNAQILSVVLLVLGLISATLSRVGPLLRPVSYSS